MAVSAPGWSIGGDLLRPAAPRRPTVLLLHGRASDERQLLPLLRAAGRDLGALAPRGPIPLPSGYAWCRRHAVGMPCTASLLAAADALGAWLEDALARCGLTAPLPAVGYSNGAMVALALAAARPDLVRQAVLVRGAYPLPEVLAPRSLAGTTIMALGGEADGLLPPAAFWSAVRLYRARGARVIARLLPGAGHGIRPEDARELRRLVAEPSPGAASARPERRGRESSRIAIAEEVAGGERLMPETALA